MENMIEPVIPWYLSCSLAEASLPLFGSSVMAPLIGVFVGLTLLRWNFSRTLSIYAGWESLIALFRGLVWPSDQGKS